MHPRHRTPTFFCWLVLFAFLMCVYPVSAHAYLDPGTGSMLLSAIIGIAATVFFMVKSFYYKAAGIFFRLAGISAPKGSTDDIVFYSEGSQYWATFQPVLTALDTLAANAPKETPLPSIVYLTSNPNDPGLTHPFSHVTARFIGTGSRAFAVLNMLEAAVCISTTPGLDVLQIRRSPGVRHYAHLVHSLSDMSIYKLYSFDWFDSVLCAGPHQIPSLRSLENLRGTPKKRLLETGCLYMDVLAEQREHALATQTVNTKISSHPSASADTEAIAPPNAPYRILVAPTWGRNGLLARFGSELILPLAQEGFSVTIRPHPQSVAHEKELMEQLTAELAAFPNVRWDTSPSGFAAMMDADVLVSDLSGIILDYALIFERPVITVQFTLDTRGMEAGDLPTPPWEMDILPQIGAHVTPEECRDMPKILRSLPTGDAFTTRMRQLRADCLFNFRTSGVVAAEQILALQKELTAKAADDSLGKHLDSASRAD